MHELRLVLADGTDVAAALHVPAEPADATAPAVVLLPGARGDHTALHLCAVSELLARAGHPVVRAALSPRPPGAAVVGPAERSIGRARDVLTAARGLVENGHERPWVLGGASYGGRVASLAIAQQGGAALGIVGLLLIAYPLHPPGRPERLRVAHWPAIDVPVLMLSGGADPFSTEQLLARYLDTFAGRVTRLVVPGGRHDLSVSARSAPDRVRRTPGDAIAAHAAELRGWVAALA